MEPALSRKEIFDRRQASVARYDAEEKIRDETFVKTKNRMEKEVVDEQIKVDAHKRNTIDNAKKSELKKAQDIVF